MRHPLSCFRWLRAGGAISEALLYACISLASLSLLVQVAVRALEMWADDEPLELRYLLPHAVDTGLSVIRQVLVCLILVPLFSVMDHGVLRVLRRAREPLRATLRGYAFCWAPVSFIFIGGYLLPGWELILIGSVFKIPAYHSVQGVGWVRATIAALFWPLIFALLGASGAVGVGDHISFGMRVPAW